MILRIELEDFEGVREYAKFDQFYVSNEFLRYRLSISGYRYQISLSVCLFKFNVEPKSKVKLFNH